MREGERGSEREREREEEGERGIVCGCGCVFKGRDYNISKYDQTKIGLPPLPPKETTHILVM